MDSQEKIKVEIETRVEAIQPKPRYKFKGVEVVLEPGANIGNFHVSTMTGEYIGMVDNEAKIFYAPFLIVGFPFLRSDLEELTEKPLTRYQKRKLLEAEKAAAKEAKKIK